NEFDEFSRCLRDLSPVAKVVYNSREIQAKSWLSFLLNFQEVRFHVILSYALQKWIRPADFLDFVACVISFPTCAFAREFMAERKLGLAHAAHRRPAEAGWLALAYRSGMARARRQFRGLGHRQQNPSNIWAGASRR